MAREQGEADAAPRIGDGAERWPAPVAVAIGQSAPLPRSTAGMVIQRIFMSSHSDQFSM